MVYGSVVRCGGRLTEALGTCQGSLDCDLTLICCFASTFFISKPVCRLEFCGLH